MNNSNNNILKGEEKYKDLISKMPVDIAKRYVLANIAHWKYKELESSRTKSLEYWEDVLYYFK